MRKRTTAFSVYMLISIVVVLILAIYARSLTAILISIGLIPLVGVFYWVENPYHSKE